MARGQLVTAGVYWSNEASDSKLLQTAFFNINQKLIKSQLQ